MKRTITILVLCSALQAFTKSDNLDQALLRNPDYAPIAGRLRFLRLPYGTSHTQLMGEDSGIGIITTTNNIQIRYDRRRGES